ncbi:unnamed protein product [Caenorhabditis angaria]|uniref:Uncharacterized protein n=1 Tax=Caenorhabditis angaria TaxID=860376 RepID=A0A9P1N5T8_9PELO|nr:unnamed protein product [Caenorhabditis angaria]
MSEEFPTRSSTRKRKATKRADFVYFDGKNNASIENEAVVEEPPNKLLCDLKEMDTLDIIYAHLESLERRMDLITKNYNCLIDTNQSLSFQKSQFLGNSSLKEYKYTESDEVAIGIVMEKCLRVISHFHK